MHPYTFNTTVSDVVSCIIIITGGRSGGGGGGGGGGGNGRGGTGSGRGGSGSGGGGGGGKWGSKSGSKSQWVALLQMLQSGGRAAAGGLGAVDFGFGDNAVYVHRKNVRDQREEQEPYDRLPEEMKAQVCSAVRRWPFFHTLSHTHSLFLTLSHPPSPCPHFFFLSEDD